MMGAPVGRQDRLFYEFDLEDMVPADHFLRKIDAVLDLSWLRSELAPYYSHLGCPSVCPELMIRLLIVGYCYSIRSERRLCDEVKASLVYRWFCGLGLEDKVPHHSSFSVNRHGRFRDSDIPRKVFEEAVCGCMTAGLVGGEGFAVDATETMIERTEDRFGLKPDHIAGDVAYGTGKMLGWLVERNITPHIPVWDRTEAAADGIYSRAKFDYDQERDIYICPNGKTLTTTGRVVNGNTLYYRARKANCGPCPLKELCCPKSPVRRVQRDVNEAARDIARSLADTEPYHQSAVERKKIERLFGEIKHIHALVRLRLRGLTGARDEFLLAATVQNLKRLAKHVIRPPPGPIIA